MRNFVWALLLTFGCAAAPAVLYQEPAPPVEPVVTVDPAELLMRAWEAQFLLNFCPPAPLILERLPLDEHTLGQTSIEGGPGAWVLRVVIQEDLEGQLMLAVLMHELAHVMSFHPEMGGWWGYPHGPEFGLWYSRIWMSLIEGVAPC